MWEKKEVQNKPNSENIVKLDFFYFILFYFFYIISGREGDEPAHVCVCVCVYARAHFLFRCTVLRHQLSTKKRIGGNYVRRDRYMTGRR